MSPKKLSKILSISLRSRVVDSTSHCSDNPDDCPNMFQGFDGIEAAALMVQSRPSGLADSHRSKIVAFRPRCVDDLLWGNHTRKHRREGNGVSFAPYQHRMSICGIQAQPRDRKGFNTGWSRSAGSAFPDLAPAFMTTSSPCAKARPMSARCDRKAGRPLLPSWKRSARSPIARSGEKLFGRRRIYTGSLYSGSLRMS